VDLGSLLGIVLGLSAILVGNALEGGHLSALFQPTALLIVVGGTMGATMLGVPLKVFLEAVKALKVVFLESRREPAALIDEIVEYAQKARRDGIISLEPLVEQSHEPFLKKAMLMAIDGADSKTMRDNLELIIDRADEDGERVAKVWESAGGFAPTIGIVGAVMGLIHVMQNLSNVSAVGSGIAVAFVATIYGVSLANLLFLPAAAKLKLKLRAEITLLELMMEGALAIQEGMKPNLVREKLEAFHHEEKKQSVGKGAASPAQVRA
jgi:chemotaxis protein MotA